MGASRQGSSAESLPQVQKSLLGYSATEKTRKAGGVMPAGANKFCKLRNLRNESDVEQNFIIRLLDDLGFTEDYRETKATLQPAQIDKGRRRRSYVPYYVCYLDTAHKLPALIVDAKSPREDSVDGLTDAQLYASVLRRKLPLPKPEQFCIGSNGAVTLIAHYDSDKARKLLFDDFNDGNAVFGIVERELTRKGSAYKSRRRMTSFFSNQMLLKSGLFSKPAMM